MSRKYAPYGPDRRPSFGAPERNYNDASRWPQERHATSDRRRSIDTRVSSMSAVRHASRFATSDDYRRRSPSGASYATTKSVHSVPDRNDSQSRRTEQIETNSVPSQHSYADKHLEVAHRYSQDALYLSKAKEMAMKTEQMLFKLGALKQNDKTDLFMKESLPMDGVSVKSTEGIGYERCDQINSRNYYDNCPKATHNENFGSASAYPRDASNDSIEFDNSVFTERHRITHTVPSRDESERPSYDPTIQNILKSIGFNFEFSNLSQSESKVDSLQEDDKSFAASENTDALIDPFVGSTFLNQGTEFKAKFLEQEKSNVQEHARPAKGSKKLYDDFSDSDDHFDSHVSKHSPEDISRSVKVSARVLPNRHLSTKDARSNVKRRDYDSTAKREASSSSRASGHESNVFQDVAPKDKKSRRTISSGDRLEKKLDSRERRERSGDWHDNTEESNPRGKKNIYNETRERDVDVKKARQDAESSDRFRRNSKMSEERQQANDQHRKDVTGSPKESIRKVLRRSVTNAEVDSELDRTTPEVKERKVIVTRWDSGAASGKEKLSESMDKVSLANLQRDLKALEKRRNELLSKSTSRKDAKLVHNEMLQEDIKKQIMQLRKRKFHTPSPHRVDSKQESKNKRRKESSPLEHSRDARNEAAQNISAEPAVAVSRKQEAKPNIEKVKLKKMKVNCIYEDDGDHWCKLCNLVSSTLAEHLAHLHSSTHAQRLDEHKPSCHPTKKVVTNTLRQALAVPFKGVEFLTTSRAFLCTLCKEFVMDADLVEVHLKSDGHNEKYQRHIAENPQYESLYKVNMALSLCNKTPVDKETVDTKAATSLNTGKPCQDTPVANMSEQSESAVTLEKEPISAATKALKKNLPFIGKLPHLRRAKAASAAAATIISTADTTHTTLGSSSQNSSSADTLVMDAALENAISVGEDCKTIPLPPDPIMPRMVRKAKKKLTAKKSAISVEETVPTCLYIPVDQRSKYEDADRLAIAESEPTETMQTFDEFKLQFDKSTDTILKDETVSMKPELMPENSSNITEEIAADKTIAENLLLSCDRRAEQVESSILMSESMAASAKMNRQQEAVPDDSVQSKDIEEPSTFDSSIEINSTCEIASSKEFKMLDVLESENYKTVDSNLNSRAVSIKSISPTSESTMSIENPLKNDDASLEQVESNESSCINSSSKHDELEVNPMNYMDRIEVKVSTSGQGQNCYDSSIATNVCDETLKSELLTAINKSKPELLSVDSNFKSEAENVEEAHIFVKETNYGLKQPFDDKVIENLPKCGIAEADESSYEQNHSVCEGNAVRLLTVTSAKCEVTSTQQLSMLEINLDIVGSKERNEKLKSEVIISNITLCEDIRVETEKCEPVVRVSFTADKQIALPYKNVEEDDEKIRNEESLLFCNLKSKVDIEDVTAAHVAYVDQQYFSSELDTTATVDTDVKSVISDMLNTVLLTAPESEISLTVVNDADNEVTTKMNDTEIQVKCLSAMVNSDTSVTQVNNVDDEVTVTTDDIEVEVKSIVSVTPVNNVDDEITTNTDDTEVKSVVNVNSDVSVTAAKKCYDEVSTKMDDIDIEVKSILRAMVNSVLLIEAVSEGDGQNASVQCDFSNVIDDSAASGEDCSLDRQKQ